MPIAKAKRLQAGITITIIAMNIGMAEAALYDLLTWMSPAWPIGAFAHSSGLEWAVEAGHIIDRETTRDWIADLIEHGPIHNDLVIFVHTWRVIASGDAARFSEIAELSLATQTGMERHIEATAQGNACRKIGNATLEDLPAGTNLEEITYPVAMACMTASQAIPLTQALTAYAHGVVSNLVSAAQRLVPLGQTDGQLVLRDLRTVIFGIVETMSKLPEDDPFCQLGGAALIAEMGCMAHETQYTRLFRT